MFEDGSCDHGHVSSCFPCRVTFGAFIYVVYLELTLDIQPYRAGQPAKHLRDSGVDPNFYISVVEAPCGGARLLPS